jgi:carbonic anhydrase
MFKFFLLLAAGIAYGPAALAADWQAIVSDRSKQVEIDRASVLQSDPGTKVAWGRIVFLKGATYACTSRRKQG